MKMRGIVVFLLAAVVGVAAFLAVGHWLGERQPHTDTCQAGSLGTRLNLSPDQETKIEAINAEFREERANIRARHARHRKELINLLQQSPPDRELIDKEIERINKLQKKMQHQAVDHILDVASELDDEQKKQLFELLDEAMCPGAMMGAHGEH